MEQLRTTADKAFEEERYQVAIECYRQILEGESNDLNSWKRIGRSYIMTRNYEQAARAYETVIRMSPDDSDAYDGLGYAQKWLKMYDEALDNFRKALKLDPRNEAAYSNMGNTLRKLGRLTEALKCYETALEIDQRFHYAHNGRGNILFDLDRLDEALQAYEKAIAIQPNFYNAYNGKGNVLRNMGKVKEAMKNYDKALEICPTYTYAWNGKGNSYSELDMFKEALDCYQHALDIDPKYSNSYIGKGNCLKKFGQQFQALNCYSMAIQFDPSNVLAFCYRGALLLSTDPQQARDDLLTSQRLLENPRILNHLSQRNGIQTKDSLQKLINILQDQNTIDRHLETYKDVQNPKLKSRVNELIAFKEESRKRINEKLDENNENNLNGRMSYNTLVQELEQIEKEYKTIVSELRKHSMELEHQTIQINKHEEEINWLIDVQKTAGVQERSELKNRILELRKEDINYHEYYRSFYWTLFNYFMTYKMISSGLLSTTEAGVETQREKFIYQFAKLTLDVTSKVIPIAGDFCQWINKILEKVYDEVKSFRFEQRVAIINKLINLTTITFEDLDMQIAKAAVNITILKKQEIRKCLDSETAVHQGMFDHLKESVMGKKISLFESPASMLALKDVTAFLGYVYVKHELLFPIIEEAQSPRKTPGGLKLNKSQSEISTAVRVSHQYDNLIKDIHKEINEQNPNEPQSLSDIIEDIVMTKKGDLLLKTKAEEQLANQGAQEHKGCCMVM